MAAVYDPFMRKTEAACLSAWRHELLEPLHGAVLEVGAGTGANLAYYPAQVTKLVLCEPDPHMRRTLTRESHRSPLPSEVVDALAEDLPYPDQTFDFVVATLVFCSVSSPPRALAQCRRILKPSGRLVFLEHVAAEGHPSRLALQHACQPIWKRVAGNCHLTRETHRLIESAGFELISYARESMGKALPILRPSVRGVARLV
jgi:ubiquinone/menaquinone biosynthesis C-methylase UbiE